MLHRTRGGMAGRWGEGSRVWGFVQKEGKLLRVQASVLVGIILAGCGEGIRELGGWHPGRGWETQEDRAPLAQRPCSLLPTGPGQKPEGWPARGSASPSLSLRFPMWTPPVPRGPRPFGLPVPPQPSPRGPAPQPWAGRAVHRLPISFL